MGFAEDDDIVIIGLEIDPIPDNDCGLIWQIGNVVCGPITEGGSMSVTLDSIQEVNLAVMAVDRRGNPVPVPDPPAWSVTPLEMLDLTVDTVDPHKALLKAKGPVGTGSVNVTLGTLSGSLSVIVVAAPAAQAIITPDVPKDQ